MVSLQERLTRPLPDLWDWEPVVWSPWRDDLITGSSANFHWPLEALACHDCGTLGKYRTCHGKRPIRRDLDETYPIRSLYAFRCADCGQDTVIDQRTEESWDLDDTDYGPAGSAPPEYAHTTNTTEPEPIDTLF